MRLENQYQLYNGIKYSVCDLIQASKDIEAISVEIGYVYSIYEYTSGDSDEACTFVKRVNNSDTSIPILLSPSGFVLDGKHRLVKARIEGLNKIKVKRFEVMPECGFCDD